MFIVHIICLTYAVKTPVYTPLVLSLDRPALRVANGCQEDSQRFVEQSVSWCLALVIHCTCRRVQVWVRPSAEMQFLYGNHVLKSGLGRITEGTPAYTGVVSVPHLECLPAWLSTASVCS